MSDKVLLNCHQARQIFPVKAYKPFKDGSDIVTYVRKNKVVKVGDGDDDYVLEEVIVEESRVNRAEYIKAQCADIGVLKIIDKVRRSGDLSLLNQVSRVVRPSHEVDSLGRPLEDIQDFTQIPDRIGTGLNRVEQGAKNLKQVQQVLGDVSMEDLAKMSAEEIKSRVSSFVNKNLPKKVIKKGE